MAVMRDKTAGFQTLAAVEVLASALEGSQQPADPYAPVLGAEHQYEVVIASMTGEVVTRANPSA